MYSGQTSLDPKLEIPRFNLLELDNRQLKFADICIMYHRAVEEEGQGGHGPPQIFGNQGGQIMPITLLLAPTPLDFQNFRRS